MSKTITISDKMWERLIYLSTQGHNQKDFERDNPGEYFNADDMSGGNFDDAYVMGVDDGNVEVAKDILDSVRMENERK